MRNGNQVYVKPASVTAREWNIAADTKGTVICSYKVLRPKAKDTVLIDVLFEKGKMLWGRPQDEFIALAD